MIKRAYTLTLWFMIAVALAGCGASTSYNVATERQETLFISTAREVRLGESVARKVEEEFDIVYNPELLERLDRVSSRIAAVADRKDLGFRFTIVKEKLPNAFALPGGPIYVTSGLFDLVETDDELAAVIAHEVGHVVAKHAVKRIQGAVGMQLFQILAVGVGKADARARQGMDLAFASILTAYSQRDELEADRLSAKYLKAAGFDVKAAITFIERLREYSFDQPVRRFSYFRTHPYYADRVRMLRQTTEGKITFDDYINKKE